MLNSKILNREKIYLLGLVLLVVGIPLSHFIMSIAQFILLFNWLLDKNIYSKIKRFYSNKAALAFSFIFVIHVLGVLFTSDFEYAFKDLRTKLPLLVLPIIISSSPIISYNNYKRLLQLYVAAVLFGTLASFLFYLTNKVSDLRNISIFISHIRFSLNICMAICILFYFIIIKKEIINKYLWLYVLVFLWLIVYLFVLQSLTGIVILMILVVSISIYYIIIMPKLYLKLISVFVLLIFAFTTSFFIINTYQNYFNVAKVDISKLDQFTSSGNKYSHNINEYGIENGHYVGLYICEKELYSEWSNRSSFKLDSLDQKGQLLGKTLLRYLNSKNLRKDAEGIKSLNDNEIKDIEGGCANYLYKNDLSLKTRLYKIFFEYNNFEISGTTKGHSVFQRIELWKAALGIIEENFWLGVGTGDMVIAYENQLNKMNSDLKGMKIRAHNQYLSIFSAFGVFGFLIFIFSLVYPVFFTKKAFNFLFLVFFIIISLSMLNEDTIESQAGVTLFAFFYSFFISKN